MTLSGLAPLLASLLALAAAGPASGAVSGSYTASNHRLSVHMSADGDVARLSVDGGAIRLNGAPIAGGPTVDNVGSISIEDDPTVDATAVLDLRGGPFAPGYGSEARPNPEIEVSQSVGDGSDELHVILPDAGGDVALGWDEQANSGTVNLNADEGAPADSDVPQLADVEHVTITGGAGADVVSAAGGPGTGQNPGTAGGPFEGPLTLLGGGGEDVVTGGNGQDRVDVRDGLVDVVACGPGVDVVAADEADVLAGDCETRAGGELPPPLPGGGNPTPGGGTPDPPLGRSVPRVALLDRRGRLRRGRTQLALGCFDAACTGTVILSARNGRRKKLLGSGRYTTTPGSRVNVRLRLSRAGRALLKRRRRARVSVKVTVAGGTAITTTLTLMRR